MKPQQKGVVLLVSLVLLLLLTIIAISAASQSRLQLRISSNSQQQSIAFQGAESGIAHWATTYFRPGQSWIPSVTGTLSESSAHGTWEYSATPDSGSSIPVDDGNGMSNGVYLIRFDILSTGRACDNDGNCTVEAVHRQGMQNRYIDN